jgi:hypothetical protein
MKKLTVILFLMVSALAAPIISYGQEQVQVAQTQDEKIYVITKQNGYRFVGRILQQDAREVLIETLEHGPIYIPRHEIREIRQTTEGEISARGTFVPAEVFSTRYFITTNGLPIKKGETYMLLSLAGPDFQFGVAENFGLGVITTWLGTPIIGTAKYSIPVDRKISMGVGVLVGTGSWIFPEFAMVIPYGVITTGDRVRNFNFSFGYGGFRLNAENSEGNFLISLAGMTRVGNKISLVFDSFIVPRTGTYMEDNNSIPQKRYSVALFIPGMRFQTHERSAFQFGFAGFMADGKVSALPLPMVQWFRML